MAYAEASYFDPGEYSDNSTDDSFHIPLLLRLLSAADWGSALDRIRSHPHEVQFTGYKSQRTSALHCAIHGSDDGSSGGNPPLEVVRSLVEAGDRNSVLVQSDSGMTALHLAVSRGVGNAAMNEVIRTILRASSSPEGTVAGERGAAVMELETVDGQTPLGCFGAAWTDFVLDKGKTILADALGGQASSPADLIGPLRVLWDRADILLRATARESVAPSGDRDRLVLHRMLSSPETLPRSLLRLAFQICTEQGWERDRNGRVPLAVAAMNPGHKYGVSMDDWIYPIKMLTETCPSTASMADNDGRLPLHLAINAGYRVWDTGIEAILLDAPRALATRDKKTHLYPFMMAAIDTKTDLTTVFLLLRENPTLAWGLAEDPPWVKTTKLQYKVKWLEGENAELKMEVSRLKSQIASMRTCSQGMSEKIPAIKRLKVDDETGENADRPTSQKRRRAQKA